MSDNEQNHDAPIVNDPAQEPATLAHVTDASDKADEALGRVAQVEKFAGEFSDKYNALVARMEEMEKAVATVQVVANTTEAVGEAGAAEVVTTAHPYFQKLEDFFHGH